MSEMTETHFYIKALFSLINLLLFDLVVPKCQLQTTIIFIKLILTFDLITILQLAFYCVEPTGKGQL